MKTVKELREEFNSLYERDFTTDGLTSYEDWLEDRCLQIYGLLKLRQEGCYRDAQAIMSSMPQFVYGNEGIQHRDIVRSIALAYIESYEKHIKE